MGNVKQEYPIQKQISIVKKNGYNFSRQRGSHMIFKNSEGNIIILNNHGNKKKNNNYIFNTIILKHNLNI